MAPKKNYTPEQMASAVAAVHEGASVRSAARSFNVPRITLYNKISGKSPLVCNMGPDTILSKNEELLLVRWVIAMGERRLPVTKDQLLDSVQRIITADKRPTPFTGNRPGKKWYSAFLTRHPILAERVAENMSAARVAVSEEQIKGWFTEVKDYLNQNNLSEMLNDPTRIFNTDESAFFLSPKPGKVLVKRGTRNVYLANGDEKENLTVLVTANAAGRLAPPMIVYSYNRIPANIAKNVPETWAIGKSESGWMCGETFFEYVANVFNPWLIAEGIQKPVLLFVDGHKSHLTLHLSNFCSENGIQIIALYPNSTHILQPMDIAVFRPLKLFYKKAVVDWKMQNNGDKLKKEDFAPVLKKALESITVDCIKNGFRGGGLYPFGPEYIDYSKMRSHNDPKQSTIQEQQQFLNRLESQIIKTFGQDKLDMYNKLYFEGRNVLENMALEEDMNLYIIWAHNKQTTTVPLDNSVGSINLRSQEIATSNDAGPSITRPESSASTVSSTDARIPQCQPEPTTSAIPADYAGPSSSRPKSSVSSTDARQSQCHAETTRSTIPSEDVDPPTSRPESPACTMSSTDTRQSQCQPEPTTSAIPADYAGPSSSRPKSSVFSTDARQSQCHAETTRSTIPSEDVDPPTSRPESPACTMSSTDTRQSQCQPEPTTSAIPADYAGPSSSRPKSSVSSTDARQSQCHAVTTRSTIPSEDVDPPTSRPESPACTMSSTDTRQSQCQPEPTGSTVLTGDAGPSIVQDISSPFTINMLHSNLCPNRSGCTPQKKSLSNTLGTNVPSPFKKHLFWPEETTKKKNVRKKDKVPCAVTSPAWQKYHQKKNEEKASKLKEKEQRSKERLEKKLRKIDTEMNKKKRSNIKKKPQDSSSSDDTDVDIQYQESDESEYNVELDETSLNEKECMSQIFQNNITPQKKIQNKRNRTEDTESDSELPLAKLQTKSKKKNIKMGLKKGVFVIVTYEGRAVLQFMNDNWRLIAEDFGDPFIDFGDKKYCPYSVERLFNVIPKDQFVIADF